jgi:hypothetical protein
VRGKGQAKNGDKHFWEEKFHAANGKAQVWGAGDLEENFFLFSLVPTMFTIPPSAHFGWGP